MGWMAFDRQDLRSAREAVDAAIGYAEAAGDAALLAYILGPNLGFAVTYRGHPAEGVVHGEAALRWADRIDSPRLTAFVLATTARAHAKVGDERACLTLLAQAEREMDRCPPGEEVADWLTVFDAAA